MAAEQSVHDLLVIPSNGNLYRFTANPNGSGYGNQPPVEFQDQGYRKIMNVAAVGSSQSPRGPAFAVIPNKPDPSTSQISCFLINSENIRAANPWTAGQWSSEPTTKDNGMALTPSALDDKPAELLIATGDGRVLWFKEGDGAAQELDLALEGEVYTQLRNGLVAGTVYCFAAERNLPLVNISSLFLT